MYYASKEGASTQEVFYYFAVSKTHCLLAFTYFPDYLDVLTQRILREFYHCEKTKFYLLFTLFYFT